MKQVEPVTEGFTCDAVVKYGKMQLSGTLHCPGGSVFSFTVAEPQKLNGLSLNWNGDAFTMSYLGMEWNGDAVGLPDTAFAGAIRNVLNAVSAGRLTGSPNQDGKCVIAGGSESGDYKLTVEMDGFPVSLSVPALDLEVTFQNFKVSQQQSGNAVQ